MSETSQHAETVRTNLEKFLDRRIIGLRNAEEDVSLAAEERLNEVNNRVIDEKESLKLVEIG